MQRFMIFKPTTKLGLVFFSICRFIRLYMLQFRVILETEQRNHCVYADGMTPPNEV